MGKNRWMWLLLLLLWLMPFHGLAATAGSLQIVELTHGACLYLVAGPDALLTAEFAEAPVTGLADSRKAVENAKILYDYARSRQLSGREKSPDGAGTAVFTQLEEGFYLVCSLAPEPEFAPFLVSVPTEINGERIYDLIADPKEDYPTEPTEPEETTQPTEPEPDIPQTGSSVWPKYALLILGVAVTLLGMADLILGREKKV